MHILFVDDEMQFSAMTAEYLQEKGFEVTLKHSAADGLNAFRSGKYDCCIFDVRMPFRDGFALAGDVRALDENVPILFLTGQNRKEDRIKGLTLGADDYVTKPFSMEELYLRIKAIMKRVQKRDDSTPKQQQLGRYFFDPVSRELSLDDELVKLSSIEAKLLQLFCENINGLVRRDYILNHIWQDDHFLKDRSLNVYITKLRNYLKKDPSIEILNVHGEGYRMIVKSH